MIEIVNAIKTGEYQNEDYNNRIRYCKKPFSCCVRSDKSYDSEVIRNKVRECGSTPAIPRNKNSKTGNADIDWFCKNTGT